MAIASWYRPGHVRYQVVHPRQGTRPASPFGLMVRSRWVTGGSSSNFGYKLESDDYTLWLWLTVCHGIDGPNRNRWFTVLKNGDFPWRTASHNQRVIQPDARTKKDGYPEVIKDGNGPMDPVRNGGIYLGVSSLDGPLPLPPSKYYRRCQF